MGRDAGNAVIYARSSPIRGTSTITGDQLFAAFLPMVPAGQLANAKKACDAIVTDAAAAGLDPLVVAAIIWIETGAPGTGLPFRSAWYLAGFNMGNLGITGDNDQNAAAQTWTTPGDGVLATVAHLVGYSAGKSWRSVWDVDALGDPAAIDKRFNMAIANTPNSAGVKTLADLNRRWAIDADDDYGGKLADRANQLAAAIRNLPVITPSTPAEPVEGEPVMSNAFRRVPHPPYVDLPVSKPNGGGYGYTQIARGSRRIIGVMNHETQGHGTGQWYRNFFSCPNGERCADALVDYLITRDGTIYRFNDPANDRSPWANGGSLGLEGDGPAFYAAFGASGINNRLISIEHEALYGEPWTDAQVKSSGLLNAYWHDQDGQGWDAYPYVSKYGCVTSLAHFEIGTTSCGTNSLPSIARVQAVARGQMQKYQTGADKPAEPNPPSVPEQPSTPALPGGAVLADVVKAFGTLTKRTPDGKTKIAPFDPRGIISLSYTHRCVEAFGLDYDRWPAAEDWFALSDSGKALDIVTFSNEWQLIRTAERQGVMWARFVDAELEAA